MELETSSWIYCSYEWLHPEYSVFVNIHFLNVKTLYLWITTSTLDSEQEGEIYQMYQKFIKVIGILLCTTHISIEQFLLA